MNDYKMQINEEDEPGYCCWFFFSCRFYVDQAQLVRTHVSVFSSKGSEDAETSLSTLQGGDAEHSHEEKGAADG